MADSWVGNNRSCDDGVGTGNWREHESENCAIEKRQRKRDDAVKEQQWRRDYEREVFRL